MKVVAYYTRGTPYESDAALLDASLEVVGMEHEIRAVEDRGSWELNTAIKAEVCRSFRAEYSGPLVYLDADAFVHTDFSREVSRFVERGYDFGAHFYKGHDHGRVRPKGGEMLSGTMLLGDTHGCRYLLDLWVELNAMRERLGDAEGGGQRNLWFALRALEEVLSVWRLPGRLCYAFDRPSGYPEGEPCWIEHTIASRENRGSSAGKRHPGRRQRIVELRELVGT